MTSATEKRTTELLHVGDILWNKPCDERMVVVAADSVCVWVRKVEKNDKLMMAGGDVWASLSRERGIKNRCSQHYAQTVFELDGHVEQAIAVTLGSEREKELEELVRDMFDVAARGEFDVGEEFEFHERMAELGIEVNA